MRNFSNSIFVRFAIILFSVFCIVIIINLQFKYNDYQAQIEDKRAELEEKENLVDELEREVDAPFDKEYIIKIAKEKLGLRLPPEIIFYNGD